jgi:PAS domain S-box-containing protein
MSVDLVIAPEYLTLSFSNWDSKLEHQTDATIYELEALGKDGRRVPLEVNTRLIYEAGKAVGVQGIARNISERKQAEAALRMSEEKYRDLFEYANDVIYTHDLQGNFLSVNQKAEQITGYVRDEVVKLNIGQIIAPEYIELAKSSIIKKLNGESTNTVYELEVICKDGSKRALEVNTRLIYQGQRPVGVQGIARDVSERKQLEEQLRQSQKMEAVGRLAGAVAHDFNNLLTAILGYSQLLLRRLDPNGPMRKELVEIEKAGQRAAALTNQLLAFSRKQVFQPQVLNLNLVVADIEKMLQRLIGEDIELRAILDPALGPTKADRGRIEQVIMNLVVNSRDAMPRGGQLTIYTANVELDDVHIEAKPGSYIMLAVADTGSGMDKETQSHIFEPFFTTKEPGKGTGLGLSTVYGIVKQSGGYITCQSEPRQGTVFRIYLPRIEEPSERLEGQMPMSEALLGHETILLVEDDDAVRELTHQMLEMNGYAVLEASNAQDALSICRQRTLPIPLLITDVVMPLTNGPELVQQVLQLRPETKVLYISGYTDNPLALRSKAEGSLPLLQKPFTPEGLTRKVREILDSA